jgi:CTP synthase (UTP-ammonia lyase)
MIHVGLIGDYNPEVTAHIAIPRAIALAAQSLECGAETTWLPTPSLEHNTERLLADYDALWCVPASPYKSMEGALRAIRFARERGVPFLGSCGGSQHVIIESARNVLGLEQANHAESNTETSLPIIAPLSCSLVEVQGTVYLKAGSRVAAIYGKDEVVEMYHCSFGLNPDYQSLFAQSALCITGVDENGEARVFELEGHPFFIATLFQPERAALKGVIPPLARAFLQAAR